MTEPGSDRVREAMERFGYTEKEARAAAHLDDAERLFDELRREYEPEPDLAAIIWAQTHTHEHFNALRRRLGVGVLRRDYPEGWGRLDPLEDEDPG